MMFMNTTGNVKSAISLSSSSPNSGVLSNAIKDNDNFGFAVCFGQVRRSFFWGTPMFTLAGGDSCKRGKRSHNNNNNICQSLDEGNSVFEFYLSA